MVPVALWVIPLDRAKPNVHLVVSELGKGLANYRDAECSRDPNFVTLSVERVREKQGDRSSLGKMVARNVDLLKEMGIRVQVARSAEGKKCSEVKPNDPVYEFVVEEKKEKIPTPMYKAVAANGFLIK
jgi:uncharacterized protein YqgV (UPF0045/DUF77 family)